LIIDILLPAISRRHCA